MWVAPFASFFATFLKKQKLLLLLFYYPILVYCVYLLIRLLQFLLLSCPVAWMVESVPCPLSAPCSVLQCLQTLVLWYKDTPWCLWAGQCARWWCGTRSAAPGAYGLQDGLSYSLMSTTVLRPVLSFAARKRPSMLVSPGVLAGLSRAVQWRHWTALSFLWIRLECGEQQTLPEPSRVA